MVLARWQGTIVDEAGNVLPGASIQVRAETPGAPLAVIYSDRSGTTPIANPFTADAEGFAAFHAAGGSYRITATLGSYSRDYRYVAIGTAGEYDAVDIVALVQNVDAGYALLFENDVVAPPSAGSIRFNNALLSSATVAYVSTENLAGSDIEDRLLELFNSGRAVKDSIIITDVTNNLQASFYVSNATLNGSYVTLSLTNHSGETSFTDGYAVNLQRERAGADGVSGEVSGPGNGTTISRQIAIFIDTTGTEIKGADDGSSPTDPLTIDNVLSLISAKQTETANLTLWSSIAPYLVPQVSELIVTNNSGTPNSQIDITFARALLFNSSNVIIPVAGTTLTINCAGTGANGLDTGSLANTTWYYLWLISNGTTTAALASASSSSPTMPSGYTYKLRVGAMRTNGSAQFLRTRQLGKNAQYVVGSGTTVTAMIVIASGSSGSITTPTWTATSISSIVPSTATKINGVISALSGVTIFAPNNSYGDWSSTSNPPPHVCYAPASQITSKFEFVLESSNVYYASNHAAGRAYCMGWTDNIPAI